jgi:hypothetical protein
MSAQRIYSVASSHEHCNWLANAPTVAQCEQFLHASCRVRGDVFQRVRHFVLMATSCLTALGPRTEVSAWPQGIFGPLSELEVASETRTIPTPVFLLRCSTPKSQAEDRAAHVSQKGTVADRFLTAWKQLQAKISSRWRDPNKRIREPDAAAILAWAERQHLLNGDAADFLHNHRAARNAYAHVSFEDHDGQSTCRLASLSSGADARFSAQSDSR